jgi:hypothetical protein
MQITDVAEEFLSSAWAHVYLQIFFVQDNTHHQLLENVIMTN